MKSKVIELHKQFFREGKLLEARKVLRLLIRKSISLGLDDVDWNVDTSLSKLSITKRISRNGNIAVFYLTK